MADAAAAESLANLSAAESPSVLKSVSAPALEQQHPGLHPSTEQDAISFYSASGPALEKPRGSPLGHRASLALSSFTAGEKRHLNLQTGGDMSGTDQELTLKELAERAALPSSGLVKDRCARCRLVASESVSARASEESWC
jgi:hypothetical protein